MEISKSIARSVSGVMLVVLAVKIIGFLKQAVIAAYFGASLNTDTFILVSETMENIGAAIFSAISVSFLALYVETYNKEGRLGTQKLINNTFLFIFPFIVVITLTVILLSNDLIVLIAPGFTGMQKVLAAKYMKIFSITIISMFICSMCTAILEAEKIFIPGKIVGGIRSIAVIMACIVLSKSYGIDALLIGTILYYIIESVFLLWSIRKKYKFTFEKPWADNRVKKIVKLTLPLFISNGCVQLQGIVDKAIASGFKAGTIAALSYSLTLFNFVHSIFIGSICAVIFSYLASMVQAGNIEEIKTLLYKYIKIIVICLSPIVVIMCFYSVDIITVIFERGAFDSSATRNTAITLSCYSLGLVFIGIRDLLIRAHYAFGDTKQAMTNGIIGVVINIFFSITLSKIVGFAGIAIATTFSSICITFISIMTIKKHIKSFTLVEIVEFVIKEASSFIILCICAITCNAFISLESVFVTLFIKAMIIVGLYYLLLKIFRVEEFLEVEKSIINMIKERVVKK